MIGVRCGRVAAAVGFAASLAGCGSGGPAGATPPAVTHSPAASPSAAVTGLPSSSPAISPSAAPQPSATPFVSSADEAGAFAFVREYLRRESVAAASLDPTPLLPLRLDSCSCVQFEENLRHLARAGSHVRGSGTKVQQLLLGTHGPAYAKVTAYVHTSAVSVDGFPEQDEAAQDRIYFFDLRRQGDRYVVAQLSELSHQP